MWTLYKGEKFFKVGDIVYILGVYVPLGDTRIVEAEIKKTYKNGKVLAYTTGGEPGKWEFYQNYFGKSVFRTHEEAERVLKESGQALDLSDEAVKQEEK